jgi:hypothetical protein
MGEVTTGEVTTGEVTTGEVTINDIPYEVMFDYILPFITIKEIGVMSSSSPVWRQMCQNQEVWKILYLRTIPYRITDDSVHIGSRQQRALFCRGRRPCGGSLWENDREISWRECAFSATRWESTSGSVRYLECIPASARSTLLPFSEIRQDGIMSDKFRPPLSEGLPGSPARESVWEGNISMYIDYVENELAKYNRSQGLSVYNLCQCPDHYKFDTLKLADKFRNYKDFRKVLLNKMKTQNKANIRKQSKILRTKLKAWEQIQSARDIAKDEYDAAHLEMGRLDSFAGKIFDAIE